jgi:hypothetical protein
VRCDRVQGIARAHGERLTYLEHSRISVLHLDSRLRYAGAPFATATIQGRELGALKENVEVVDAIRHEWSEQVFDHAHPGFTLSEYGLPERARDVIDRGRNLGLSLEIHTPKHESPIGDSRPESDPHRAAGVQAGTFGRHLAGQRALRQVVGA